MSSNLKTLHKCFWIVIGKILNEVRQDYGKKKRRIALMITKNQFWSWNKKKMRWTLPLGKSQINEKINLAIGKPRVFKPDDQELSRSTKFSSPSPIIPSGLCQVSPILFTLVTSHSFHMGRSPISMRPYFIFFPSG